MDFKSRLLSDSGMEVTNGWLIIGSFVCQSVYMSNMIHPPTVNIRTDNIIGGYRLYLMLCFTSHSIQQLIICLVLRLFGLNLYTRLFSLLLLRALNFSAVNQDV